MLLNIFHHGLEYKTLFTKVYDTLQENSLLLIQDGIYFGLNIKKPTSKNVYALETDVTARGLANNYSSHVKLINYKEFVDLVLNHDKNITW